MTDETIAPPAEAADPTTNLDAPPAPEPEKVEQAKPETEAEQPKEEPPAEEDDGEEDQGDKPKRSRWQRMKERAERAERRLAEIQSQPQTTIADDADAIQAEALRRVGKPPKPEDFQDPFEYEAERAAYKTELRIARREFEREARTAVQTRTVEAQRIIDDHLERVEAFKASTPDFDKVVEGAKGKVHAETHVEHLILQSDDSGRLLYHLLKSPDLVKELNALPPLLAARRMGQIETQIQRSAQPKTTKAPAPITPPKGGASPAPDPTKGPDDMEEYVRWRKSKGR